MQNNIFSNFKKYLISQKNPTAQSGVSLVISFFIMTIILAIVLAITTLLYKEIKMIRNIGNSVVAFYVSDSGVEKVLYYDRKIIPGGATRGLCGMFYNAENYPNACPANADDASGDDDSGLYCKEITGTTFLTLIDSVNHADGCDANVCDNCIVSFTTTFPGNEKSYVAVATVTPDETGEHSNLKIESTGSYKGLSRKVELYMTKTEATEQITIENAYATPLSSGTGTSISVVAEVTAQSGVSSVKAYIKTSSTEAHSGMPASRIIDLTLSSGNTYSGAWTGTTGSYYVDILVTDAQGNTLEQSNIQSYHFDS